MEIAPCRAEDLPLLDLHMPSNSADSHHAARCLRQEAGASTYLVAWRDGAPVGRGEVRWTGCAAPEVRAALGDCPELNGLAVWPEALRGQGIGTALIRAAESLARERGKDLLGLGVDRDNPRAAALYARLGYEPGVPYTDRWAYTGEDGARHECADSCTFLVKRLG
ncbi:GNAT family N-acetyltransferase [Streptomyces sp. NPDC057445]|uniref:GNAT family N-acetyltransferase n=1 Tax=Streptomyces sp. NPDC057445 TaxID=3346136 RepID=UPI0036B89421